MKKKRKRKKGETFLFYSYMNCRSSSYAQRAVNAHFWQTGPMVEEAQQYEKGRERKQQTNDHWARMAGIMVHRPTK